MTQIPTGGMPVPPYNAEEVKKKRTMAGILGVVAGGVGVHRFYLGDTQGGIIRIAICCVGGGIVGLIEGIIYLTKTDEQFYQEYMVNGKKWF